MMIRISFISSGTTTSQTPVMASISYEMVKKWMIDNPGDSPDFPVACIIDLSNMYSTLQFFASDKILMRMRELTSLIEVMKESEKLDWSRCSFPSKFVHKETKDPLFFMIPVFPRGMTTELTKSEATDVTKSIWDISLTIEKAGCDYLVFDVPVIDIFEENLNAIPALLNSNMIIGVVDSNKGKYEELKKEIEALNLLLSKLDPLATPRLTLNGIIFNKITEEVRANKWLEQVAEDFPLKIYGQITDDPQFSQVASQYEIPTIDSLFDKMRCALDLQDAAESIVADFNEPGALRKITEAQLEHLKDKIFSF
ncbi:MAG: hypothetical protein ACFFDI_10560 [Promethearchaeota archaeon]